jgi:hypothetical protein
LTYFTARKTETINNLRTLCATVATSTTLARIGLYTVAGNGDLTLVASTESDTALWETAGQRTKALSASYSKVRGQRYAVGVLWVGSGNAPTFAGIGSTVTAVISEFAESPRQAAVRASQSDLPATIAAGDLISGQQLYAALVP